jgi:hypothetical protein
MARLLLRSKDLEMPDLTGLKQAASTRAALAFVVVRPGVFFVS